MAVAAVTGHAVALLCPAGGVPVRAAAAALVPSFSAFLWRAPVGVCAGRWDAPYGRGGGGGSEGG